MKTQLRLVLLGACVLLVNACATSSRPGSSALAGTWTNSLGTVWTLKPNSTFDVDRNHDGKTDITGTYSINNDTFTIDRNEGKVPEGCEGPGVYKFQRKENSLTFTLVSDTCKDRKKNVLRPWHMK